MKSTASEPGLTVILHALIFEWKQMFWWVGRRVVWHFRLVLRTSHWIPLGIGPRANEGDCHKIGEVKLTISPGEWANLTRQSPLPQFFSMKTSPDIFLMGFIWMSGLLMIVCVYNTVNKDHKILNSWTPLLWS